MLFKIAKLIVTVIQALNNIEQTGHSWTRFFEGRTYTLTFTADHTWEADYTGNSDIDVWGTYSISASEITFVDTGGEQRSEHAGTYIFSVNESSLIFSVVSDFEAERMLVIEGVWLPE